MPSRVIEFQPYMHPLSACVYWALEAGCAPDGRPLNTISWCYTGELVGCPKIKLDDFSVTYHYAGERPRLDRIGRSSVVIQVLSPGLLLYEEKSVIWGQTFSYLHFHCNLSQDPAKAEDLNRKLYERERVSIGERIKNADIKFLAEYVEEKVAAVSPEVIRVVRGGSGMVRPSMLFEVKGYAELARLAKQCAGGNVFKPDILLLPPVIQAAIWRLHSDYPEEGARLKVLQQFVTAGQLSAEQITWESALAA